MWTGLQEVEGNLVRPTAEEETAEWPRSTCGFILPSDQRVKCEAQKLIRLWPLPLLTWQLPAVFSYIACIPSRP